MPTHWKVTIDAAIAMPEFASDASPPRPQQTIGSAHGNAVIKARGNKANLCVAIPAIESCRGHHRKNRNAFVGQLQRIVHILHANLEIQIRPTPPHVPGCCQQKRILATASDHGGTRSTYPGAICKSRYRMAKKMPSRSANA